MTRTTKAAFFDLRSQELGVGPNGTPAERRTHSHETLVAMELQDLQRVALRFYDMLHTAYDAPIPLRHPPRSAHHRLSDAAASVGGSIVLTQITSPKESRDLGTPPLSISPTLSGASAELPSPGGGKPPRGPKPGVPEPMSIPLILPTEDGPAGGRRKSVAGPSASSQQQHVDPNASAGSSPGSSLFGVPSAGLAPFGPTAQDRRGSMHDGGAGSSTQPPKRTMTLPPSLMSPADSGSFTPSAFEGSAEIERPTTPPLVPLIGEEAFVTTSPAPTPKGAFGATLGQFHFGDAPFFVDPAASLVNENFLNARSPQNYMAARRRSMRRVSSIVSLAGRMPPRRTSNVEEEDAESDNDDHIKKVNQFLLLEILGSGAQGTVYLAFDEKTDEFRAVKEIRRPLATSSAMELVKNEIDIMKDLRHKNIVTLHEILDDPRQKKLYLVLQYVERGVLVQYNKPPSRFHCEKISPVKLAFYARQMCAGLSYLHRHGILHRDVKPENILLGNDDQIYLADFGVAQVLADAEEDSQNITTADQSTLPSSRDASIEFFPFLSSPSTPTPRTPQESLLTPKSINQGVAYASTRGTPAFFPPEIIAGKAEAETDNALVDVWALGVTLYMFLVGVHPFFNEAKRLTKQESTLSPEEVKDAISPSSPDSWSLSRSSSKSGMSSPYNHHLMEITSHSLQEAILHHEVTFPEDTPSGWRSVLSSMLLKNPKERISLEEVRGAIKALN